MFGITYSQHETNRSNPRWKQKTKCLQKSIFDIGQLDGHEIGGEHKGRTGVNLGSDLDKEEGQDSVSDLDLEDLAIVVDLLKYSQESGSDTLSEELAADIMWDEMELSDMEELNSRNVTDNKNEGKHTGEARSSHQQLEWFPYGSQQVRNEWPRRGWINAEETYLHLMLHLYKKVHALVDLFDLYFPHWKTLFRTKSRVQAILNLELEENLSLFENRFYCLSIGTLLSLVLLCYILLMVDLANPIFNSKLDLYPCDTDAFMCTSSLRFRSGVKSSQLTFECKCWWFLENISTFMSQHGLFSKCIKPRTIENLFLANCSDFSLTDSERFRHRVKLDEFFHNCIWGVSKPIPFPNLLRLRG
ncbi:hypothetical protein VP01_845g2 [Puccinia sorghi]|uniref:Uncharacterized protein n=1 Tax=Puccinia sorghi TaxID=27349 RepID=A0A0L6U993_9BASI|nr:hypothetical protein VP01_845g2 [Puccinia sorghi]